LITTTTSSASELPHGTSDPRAYNNEVKEKTIVNKKSKSHIVIAQYIRAHPALTWQKVAVLFSVSIGTISRIAREFGLSRPSILDDDAIANRVARGEGKSSE
jgi:hypothetical protein